ncbi:18485_t:CDS:1, partial [Gigaspora rosea]
IPYNKRVFDKMPYPSKNLIESLRLPEGEQIEEIIEKDFTKVYNYMKKGLPTREELKGLIKDLPTHNDLKDLKKLIEDLKTDK